VAVDAELRLVSRLVLEPLAPTAAPQATPLSSDAAELRPVAYALPRSDPMFYA
jgi:hypothetical protein